MKTVKGIYAEAKIFTDDVEEQKKQDNTAWAEHYRIVRGNPVRIYEGEGFLLKKQ